MKKHISQKEERKPNYLLIQQKGEFLELHTRAVYNSGNPPAKVELTRRQCKKIAEELLSFANGEDLT